MAKSKSTPYQQDLIKNYYASLDRIMLQKLQELVTELYLAETPQKTERLWQRAHNAMLKLKLPASIVNHIMEKRSVEILAKNLNDWLR